LGSSLSDAEGAHAARKLLLLRTHLEIEVAMSKRRRSRDSRSRYLHALTLLVLIVAILYFAKAVIVPLALAVLLAFILTPLVVMIQRWGLRRIPAVLVVVCLAGALMGGVGWGVGVQLTNLAQDLPAHANDLKAKIARVRTSGAGPFSRLLETFRGIGDAPSPSKETVGLAKAEPKVVLSQPEESFLERSAEVGATVLEPLASAGLVLILVIFMLIRREDLRNRVIGLLGHGRLMGTTRVLVVSATRLSRLLLTQLCVNAGFGLLFSIALLLIGVPYWFLWGFLTMLLRFVPFIGSWLAASLPLLLTIAIAPGWGQPLWVLGVFIVLDLLTGNVIEPLLFGHSTGVSPVALLVAAAFWTWVWGPVGLVLSTPLTLCLVVLGQHVPRLRFLSLLLGDRPALAPHLSYYQRLLAGDTNEAALISRDYAVAKGADQVPDGVLVPALLHARRDRKNAGLTAEDETLIFNATATISEALLADERVPRTLPTPDAAEGTSANAVEDPGLVLGYPAHHKAEELTLRMLAGVLKPSGCRMEVQSTRSLPVEAEAWIERERPAAVFIAVMPPGGVPQASYLCRRLRKRFPELKIVVGYWGRVRDFDKLLVRLRSAGASYVTTTVLQSSAQIRALLPRAAILPAPADAQDDAPLVAVAAADAAAF
jgi:predicted PurR-regulated permease PerM